MVLSNPVSALRLRLIASTALVAVGFAAPALGQVSHGTVAAGTATITQSGTQTDIRQTSDRAILNWQNFSIPAGSAVRFQQPSGSSVTLNRVTGSDASTIQGQLSANGQILLINPNGILIDRGARIDVGGLTATTAGIADQDFLAGRMIFNDAGKTGATVENRGRITAAEGGYVVLAGRAVANSGVIDAKLGTVVLAGAKRFVLDLRGDRLLAFDITESVDGTPTDRDGKPVAALVDQSGTIRADGGRVTLTARAAEGVIAQAINNRGLLRAESVSVVSGEVILDGGPTGSVSHGGTIDVTGVATAAKGGQATILGGDVVLDGAASVDASGRAGGGTILVGGDYQGRPGVPTASTVTVGPAAILRADASEKGDGGKIIAWSEQGTRFSGSATAKGGPAGGNGGLVEVSSRGRLGFDGRVDLRAPLGKTGTLLLDPEDLTITATTDNNVSTTGQTLTTSGSASTLAASTILTALATADVIVQTASPSASLGTISVNASILNTTANSLTLKAHRNIDLAAGVTLSSTGGGSIALIADQANSNTGAITGTATSQITVTGGGSLSLKAGSGIGTSGSPLKIEVSGGGVLAASSRTGGIFITRTANDLTVGTAGGLTGLTATSSGSISLQGGNGNLTVSNAISTASGVVSISAGTGTLTVSTGQTISATGGLTLTADHLTLSGSLAGGSGSVSLRATTGGLAIDLGATVKPGTGLAFSQAELNRISTSAGVVVGDSSAGAVTVSQAVSLTTSGGVSVIGGGALTFASGASVTAARISLSGSSAAVTENVTASGGVTLSGGAGGLTLASTVTVGNGGGAGAVTLIGDTLSIPTGAAVVGGTGSVTLRPSSNNRTMDVLATSKPGTAFEVTSAELDRVTTSGSLTIGFANAGSTTVSQAYTRTGLNSFAIVSGGLVTLPNALTVTGGTLSVTGVGVTVNAVQTGAAVVINAGTGVLTHNSTITNGAGSGAVTLIGDSINLAVGSAVTAGSGVVTLRQASNVHPINLGPTTDIGTALEISDAEFARIATTGKVVVGDSNAGTLSFTNAISSIFTTTPLQVISGRQVVGSGYAGANLAVQAGTGIALTTSATTVAASSGSGSISLTFTGSNTTIGTVAGLSGVVSANGAIQIDAGANLLTFGGTVSNGGGANTAAITLIADKINIAAGGITGGAGLVTLRPSTSGRTVDLGSITDLSTTALEVSAAEIARINTTGTLAIGSTSGAALATSQAVATTTVNTLALLSGVGVAINHGVTVTGQLRTQSTGLTVAAGVTASGSTGVSLDSGTGLATIDGTVSNTGGAATGPITIAADRFALNAGAAITGGAGIVTVRASTNGRAIDLGATTDAGTATEISVAEANRITTTNRLVIGSTGSAISVTSAFTVGATAPTVLLTGSTIDTAASGGAFTATNLALSATGAIGASNGGFKATPTNLAAQAGGAVNFVSGGASLTVAAVAGIAGVSSTGGPIAIDLGTGQLTLTGTISNGGGASTQAITVIADRMDLQAGSSIVGGAGAVSLRPSTAGRGISLGPVSDANPALELSSAELNRIATSGSLVVGSSSAGAVTISDPISLGAGLPTVSIVSGGAITGSGAAAVLTATGAVALTAATSVGSLSVNVGTLATQAADAIDIASTGATLKVGAVAGLAGVVSTGGGAVTLDAGTGLLNNTGTISTSGAQLTLRGDRMDLATGSVVQAGTGTVVIGTSTVGRAIDLGSTTNAAAGLELSAAELATISTAAAVSISTTGAVSVSQTVTSTQILSIAGTGLSVAAGAWVTAPAGVTLNAGTGILANAGTITNGAGSGTISLVGDRINLVTGGTVQAGGGVVQVSAATAGRGIDLGSTSDSGAAIELSNAELNRIGTTQPIVIGSSTAGNAVFTAPITLAGSATEMTVTSGGSITQTGASTIFTGGGLGLKAAGVIGTSANPMLLSVSNLAAVSSAGSVSIGLTGASTTIGTVGTVAGIGAPVATSTVTITGNAVSFAPNTPSNGIATVTTTGLLTVAGAVPGTFNPLVNGTLNAISPAGTIVLIGSGGGTSQQLPGVPVVPVVPPVVPPVIPPITPPVVVVPPVVVIPTPVAAITPPPVILPPPVVTTPVVVPLSPFITGQALLTSGGLLNLLLSVAASGQGSAADADSVSSVSSALNLSSNDNASNLLTRLLGRTLLETDARRGQIPGITDYFSTLGNIEQW